MVVERLHKVLANSGVASRRACELLISAGQVTVDGKVVTEMGFKVDPAKNKIMFGGQRIKPPRPITLILNKPNKTVTTTKDEAGRRTVMQYVQHIKERVYPVGRLDWDSEGLLVMTNDGDLANLLTHPRYGVARTYHVVVRGELKPEVLERMQKGVWLSEGKTGPIKILIKKRDRESAVVEVTVHEGMNREVRRVFARFGLKVKHLKRLRVGPLVLGHLPTGAIRLLTPQEVESLRASVKTREDGHGQG
ncbi:MAG: rRNA pseudouridine synthase [Planctomycetota bacterium]|nr:MAG: rRNA pseudouridine synthase [Planctomycetota bacterium]